MFANRESTFHQRLCFVQSALCAVETSQTVETLGCIGIFDSQPLLTSITDCERKQIQWFRFVIAVLIPVKESRGVQASGCLEVLCSQPLVTDRKYSLQ